MITIFVEGNSDEYLIDSLFRDIQHQIIPYSSKKYVDIVRWIKTLDKTDQQYFFLFDTDGKPADVKLKEILNKIKNLKKENCFPVVVEIESWYRAGCCEEVQKKFKLKPLLDTEKYTKEKMLYEFKKQPLAVIYTEILQNFSIAEAMTLNKSFSNFYLKINDLINK